MPTEKDVSEKETYWCPKWYWPFAVCTRTVRKHKWCYQFSWVEETGYGVVSYLEGCENGTLFTWFKPTFMVFGGSMYPGGELCFDSPRSSSGQCDASRTGLIASPVVVDGGHGKDRYADIWEKGDGQIFEGRHRLTAARYQQTFDDLAAKGYRPRCVSGYVLNGEDRYAAVWEQTDSPVYEARHRLSDAQYQQTFDQLAARGYVLKWISGYA